MSGVLYVKGRGGGVTLVVILLPNLIKLKLPFAKVTKAV